MKRLISWMLVLCMALSLVPAGLAEEFFAEESFIDSAAGGMDEEIFKEENFFGDDSLFNLGETDDVEVEQDDEPELDEFGLETRSIISLASDWYDEEISEPWRMQPTLYITKKSDTSIALSWAVDQLLYEDDGYEFWLDAKNQLVAKDADDAVTRLSKSNISKAMGNLYKDVKFYIYKVDVEAGVGYQVGNPVAPKIMTIAPTTPEGVVIPGEDNKITGVGGTVKLDKVSDKNFYFVRAEKIQKQKTGNKEDYGESSEVKEIYVSGKDWRTIVSERGVSEDIGSVHLEWAPAGNSLVDYEDSYSNSDWIVTNAKKNTFTPTDSSLPMYLVKFNYKWGKANVTGAFMVDGDEETYKDTNFPLRDTVINYGDDGFFYLDDEYIPDYLYEYMWDSLCTKYAKGFDADEFEMAAIDFDPEEYDPKTADALEKAVFNFWKEFDNALTGVCTATYTIEPWNGGVKGSAKTVKVEVQLENNNWKFSTISAEQYTSGALDACLTIYPGSIVYDYYYPYTDEEKEVSVEEDTAFVSFKVTGFAENVDIRYVGTAHNPDYQVFQSGKDSDADGYEVVYQDGELKLYGPVKGTKATFTVQPFVNTIAKSVYNAKLDADVDTWKKLTGYNSNKAVLELASYWSNKPRITAFLQEPGELSGNLIVETDIDLSEGYVDEDAEPQLWPDQWVINGFTNKATLTKKWIEYDEEYAAWGYESDLDKDGYPKVYAYVNENDDGNMVLEIYGPVKNTTPSFSVQAKKAAKRDATGKITSYANGVSSGNVKFTLHAYFQNPQAIEYAKQAQGLEAKIIVAFPTAVLDADYWYKENGDPFLAQEYRLSVKGFQDAFVLSQNEKGKFFIDPTLKENAKVKGKYEIITENEKLRDTIDGVEVEDVLAVRDEDGELMDTIEYTLVTIRGPIGKGNKTISVQAQQVQHWNKDKIVNGKASSAKVSILEPAKSGAMDIDLDFGKNAATVYFFYYRGDIDHFNVTVVEGTLNYSELDDPNEEYWGGSAGNADDLFRNGTVIAYGFAKPKEGTESGGVTLNMEYEWPISENTKYTVFVETILKDGSRIVNTVDSLYAEKKGGAGMPSAPQISTDDFLKASPYYIEKQNGKPVAVYFKDDPSSEDPNAESELFKGYLETALGADFNKIKDYKFDATVIDPDDFFTSAEAGNHTFQYRITTEEGMISSWSDPVEFAVYAYPVFNPEHEQINMPPDFALEIDNKYEVTVPAAAITGGTAPVIVLSLNYGTDYQKEVRSETDTAAITETEGLPTVAGTYTARVEIEDKNIKYKGSNYDPSPTSDDSIRAITFKTVDVNVGNQKTDGMFTYAFNPRDNGYVATVVQYHKKNQQQTVTVPKLALGKYPVVEIGASVFSGDPEAANVADKPDTVMTAISLPATVEVIGASAFANCANLATMTETK